MVLFGFRLQTICGEVVPVRVPKPVPAIRIRGTGIRPVPEVAAALPVPIFRLPPTLKGQAPLPLRGIHPEGGSIGGEEVPVRAPKPVPAIRTRGAGTRPVPEGAASQILSQSIDCNACASAVKIISYAGAASGAFGGRPSYTGAHVHIDVSKPRVSVLWISARNSAYIGVRAANSCLVACILLPSGCHKDTFAGTVRLKHKLYVGCRKIPADSIFNTLYSVWVLTIRIAS